LAATLFDRPQTRWVRIAISALVWAVALAVTVSLASQIDRAVFVFFWGAVLFAAWYSGFWTAFVSSAAAVLAVNYFMLEPRHALSMPTSSDLLMIGIFVLNSAAVSALTSRLAAERKRTAQHAKELETYASQLQQQQIELENQTEEAQALSEELEEANEELQARSEQVEAANRAKSEFLTTMSHELRTPLNAIGGYVDLLEMGIRGSINDAQREDLERIRRSQQHLVALISSILNYSRLDAGQMDYRITDVQVHELLHSVGTMIEPQARAKSITFEVALTATNGNALVARADRDKLGQVVLNLLSNAVKFTPAGGRVVLEAALRDGHPDVEIRVRDSGLGIADENRSTIFEPFVQIGRSLTNPQDGTGLGLAISRDLARAMGGDVTVESELGAGSTFTVRLPCGGQLS